MILPFTTTYWGVFAACAAGKRIEFAPVVKASIVKLPFTHLTELGSSVLVKQEKSTTPLHKG
jgi:hypothetical protein